MKFPKSNALFQRASRVIPGGIYGHTSPAATVPLEFPYFAQSAEGCRYRDADGNAYIDYLCAYGPIILGYNHPEVEEAASRQRQAGNSFNHPTVRMVELAEKLVSLVDFADWAVFGKNGSDMTTWATQVAREATGRKKILRVQGAYHGSHPWCTPGHGGLIDEDRAHVHTFRWNDAEDFKRLVQTYRNQVAGVILTPFHHPAFGDSVMPNNDFFPTIQNICQKEGILIILDDVRAGFRLHLGGSHRCFGLQPDLICFSKALGNGYPISAALGRKELRIPSSRVFLTGSFWNSAVPMAAALKTLEILERDHIIQHLEKTGTQLREGMCAQAEKYGFKLHWSGLPALPFFRFEKETNFELSQKFTSACIQQGVFFHPHHNGFLCAAHKEQDITETLQKTERVLARLLE